MVKVLYVSHYLEKSGWGQGCRDYLRCLIQAGFDVVARPVILSGGVTNLHEDILKAEANDTKNCDVCIQQVLPHYYTYNSNYRNIGIPYLETFNLKYTSWFNKFKLMDELWVPNDDSRRDLLDSGIKKVEIVRQPVDFNRYKQKFPVLKHPSIDCNYNFYYVGDFNVRKRISSIIKCYYLACNSSDPVNLVLKCNKFNTSPENLFGQIKQLIEKIQDSLKIYSNRAMYPEVTILTQDLTDEQVLGLHKAYQCFLIPSYGEAVCLPALDAACMGNVVVGSNVGGLTEIVNYPIDGILEPVNGMQESFQDLYTGRETWFNINQNDFRDRITQVFAGRKRHKPSRLEELEKKYSYTSVGEIIKGLLI